MKNLQKFQGSSPKGVSDRPWETLAELPRALARNQGVVYTASLYFPDISPKSASRALRREIVTYPQLLEALESTNWHPNKRLFTPLQQRIIVYYLGQPV